MYELFCLRDDEYFVFVFLNFFVMNVLLFVCFVFVVVSAFRVTNRFEVDVGVSSVLMLLFFCIVFSFVVMCVMMVFVVYLFLLLGVVMGSNMLMMMRFFVVAAA